jgi:hypothetical protein
VQQRAKRAVDQRRLLVEGEVAHVCLAQVELHTRVERTGTGFLEHRRRRVDADDPPAGRLCDRNRNAAAPDRELDQRSVRLTCEFNIEGNVGRHRSRPFLVAVRKCLVPTHRPMLRPRGAPRDTPQDGGGGSTASRLGQSTPAASAMTPTRAATTQNDVVSEDAEAMPPITPGATRPLA